MANKITLIWSCSSRSYSLSTSRRSVWRSTPKLRNPINKARLQKEYGQTAPTHKRAEDASYQGESATIREDGNASLRTVDDNALSSDT